MPYDVVRNHPACPVSRPWGVVTPGEAGVHGCFPSRARAGRQQAALYATKEAGPASTPAPPRDRIRGSRTNRMGSAATGRGVTLSPSIIRGLRAKVAAHNEVADHKTNLTALKAVYRRGAGAFSTSHRPGMTRNQWSMGRVNAFLRLLRSGRPANPRYTTDNDLLPAGHPRSMKETHMEDDRLVEALSMAERKRYATIVRRHPDGSTEYKFPIPDKAHARAALAYVNRSDLTPTERARVVRKAYRVLGIAPAQTRGRMAEVMAEVTKTDRGMTFPAAAYAYVPDPARPSTWKVRLWEDPDARVTRASAARAAQALSAAGFRGSQVQLPRDAWPAVRRRVAAAWRAANPGEELPEHLAETAQETTGLTVQSIGIVSGMESQPDVPEQSDEDVLEAAELEFAEAANGTDAELSKNEVVVTVLQPGFNRSGARFYTRDAIQAAVAEGLFNNRKMFVNHPSASEMRERPERNLTDWVSTVKETWVDQETGAIKARIKVVQNWFGDFLKQLQENEALPDVGLSIFAQGEVKRKKIEGRLTDVVERFTRALSVDWVTEPGAGGRVDAIWESYQPARAKEQEINVLNTMEATEAVATLREQRPDIIEVLETEMTPAEPDPRDAQIEQLTKELEELNGKLAERDEEIARAAHAAAKAEQDALVTEAVTASELPTAARERIAAAIEEPFLNEEGGLDREQATERVNELIEAEKAYAEEILREARPAAGRGIAGLGDRKEDGLAATDKVKNDIARRMGIAVEDDQA